jgi:hypothetical protein
MTDQPTRPGPDVHVAPPTPTCRQARRRGVVTDIGDADLR